MTPAPPLRAVRSRRRQGVRRWCPVSHLGHLGYPRDRHGFGDQVSIMGTPEIPPVLDDPMPPRTRESFAQPAWWIGEQCGVRADRGAGLPSAPRGSIGLVLEFDAGMLELVGPGGTSSRGTGR